MNHFKQSLFAAAALGLFPLLTQAEVKKNPDAGQVSQKFMSSWYLLHIRGVPCARQIEKLNSDITPKLKNAFLQAGKHISGLKQNMDGPAPYAEGDFLTGIWEDPLYFHVEQVTVQDGRACVSVTCAHEQDGLKHTESKLRVLLEKISDKWCIADVVYDNRSMLAELEKIAK